MSDGDDTRRYAFQETKLNDDIQRRDQSPALSSPCLLARTTTLASYPTTVTSYFACIPQTLYGSEQEGGAGIVVAGNSYFFALNLGSTIPSVGTLILTTFTGNRWVFRYDA